MFDLNGIKGRMLRFEIPDKMRVYKLSSEEELIKFRSLISKHYKNSINIVMSGKLSKQNISYIENIADDLMYKELNLGIDDFYAVCRENPNRSSDDEKLKRFLRKKDLNVELKSNPKNNKIEYDAELWNGTAEEVALRRNISTKYVWNMRNTYAKQNPDFVAPTNSYVRKPKNIKLSNTQIKPMDNHDKDNKLSEMELSLLWKYPPSKLKKLIKSSFKEIHKLRYNYCLQNPDFIIPKIANFNSTGLNNKIEISNWSSWSEEEQSLLWEGTVNEVAEVLDKTISSVNSARFRYCEQHKDFVIPDKAKKHGGRKKGKENKIEVEKIDNNSNMEHIDEIGSGKGAEVEQKIETKNELDKSNLDNIANFLNSLKDKPKKMVINGIEIEF